MEHLAKNLEHYWMQIYGETASKKRRIVIFLFLVDPKTASSPEQRFGPTWRTDPIKILGGGADFTTAIYDLETETLSISANAEK